MPTVSHAILPDEATVAAYATDGAVAIRGVFAPFVESLRNGVEALMANPSPRQRSYRPKDGSALFFQDLCNWRDVPEFADFVLNSPAAAVAAKLMGSPTARFFHDHVLVKEPGSSIATPWHQDMPYYCVSGAQNVSFWMPLDPVPRETSLEIVAGSHLWGLDHRPRRFDGSILIEGDDRVDLPDIEAERSKHRILGWALEPGDAVAFAFRAVHGASANHSALRRRVFSARWVGEDARFLDRGGKGSPAMSHLDLKSGDPLDGPDFPLVFDAGAPTT
ncbi:MAG: phytanoyl-CoA dioxygenase family protein [Hyphomicrobiales bacterium]|nr:phytanoyl-CoA dioxygenase family protein [Hyphomicrobiales bacterium]